MDPYELQIIEGISEKHIEELIIFSNVDPEIIKNTNDPKRFKDREAFESWISKGKKIYVLTRDAQDLLGIIWFSKKGIEIEGFENHGITFAIRLYGDARGKGLSKSFAKKSIEKLKETDFYKNHDKQGIWLDTFIHNKTAHILYEKLGFKKVGEKNGRIIMVLP